MLEDVPRHDYEYADITLFHVLVLETANKPQEALKYLMDYSQENYGSFDVWRVQR